MYNVPVYGALITPKYLQCVFGFSKCVHYKSSSRPKQDILLSGGSSSGGLIMGCCHMTCLQSHRVA